MLSQLAAPHEILIMDDGSTDSTASILESYKHHITIFRQSNQGVARARNYLCKKAKGNVIAFLDADDIWHPNYLKTQCDLLTKYPEAVASFTGHSNFQGNGAFFWNGQPTQVQLKTELIRPLEFFVRYNKNPAPFGSMSFCCIPKRVLTTMGNEPFPEKLSGADDFYLMNIFPLLGSVALTNALLVAYRESVGSLSSDKLKSVGLSIAAFELLSDLYSNLPFSEFIVAFNKAFASRRRHFAKFLLGSGRTSEARNQLLASLAGPAGVVSPLKSLGLWFASYLPKGLQPVWPKPCRALNDSFKSLS